MELKHEQAQDTDANLFEIVSTALSIAGSLASLTSLLHWYRAQRYSPDLRAQIEGQCAKILAKLHDLQRTIADLRSYLESIHFDINRTVTVRNSVFVSNLTQYFLFKELARRLRHIRNEVESILDHYEELTFIKELAGGDNAEAFLYFESLNVSDLDSIVSGLGAFKFADLLAKLESFYEYLRSQVNELLAQIRQTRT